MKSSKLELQTVGDIKKITEEDEENSKIESLMQPRYYQGYLPNLATQYAITHVHSPNPNFADFTEYGGDCTNFVSQSLASGGVRQVIGQNYGENGWFYTTSSQRSSTWTGAHQFGNYWRGKVPVFTGRYKGDIIKYAGAGEVIQYKEYATGLRYHSVMVTSTLSDDLYIAQRTGNYYGLWSGRGGIHDHNGYETYFDLLKFGR